MKVIIVSVVAALGLAIVAGYLLDDAFSTPADSTFATPSARVGESGSVASRHFDGK